MLEAPLPSAPEAPLPPALEALLPELVATLRQDAPAELADARTEFFERTGAFDATDAFYETRIAYFFDWYLCAYRPAAGPPVSRVAVDDGPLAEAAKACLGALRGLYQVRAVKNGTAIVEDLLGGARFRAVLESHDRLEVDEVLDGHLLWLEGAPRLAPGRIFHPPSTHEALRALLPEVADWDKERLLDALLRVRMRLDRFTSMHPRHLYRREALEDRAILSAAWARKAPGPDLGETKETREAAGGPAASRSEDP